MNVMVRCPRHLDCLGRIPRIRTFYPGLIRIGFPLLFHLPAAALFPASNQLILILAVVVGVGGILLLFASALLTVMAFMLFARKGIETSGPRTDVPHIVPEPTMPLEISTELTFSTGIDDANPDEIATEVFVRTESIPPDDVDTIDELPGKLLARRTPNKD